MRRHHEALAAAGATYTLVFGLCFVAILTGLMLRGASADPDSLLRWFTSRSPLVGGLYVAHRGTGSCRADC